MTVVSVNVFCYQINCLCPLSDRKTNVRLTILYVAYVFTITENFVKIGAVIWEICEFLPNIQKLKILS